MAKNFTSEVYDYSLTQEGFKERLELLRKAAARGGCLLKGELSEPLVDEPRAGKGLTAKANRSLILDIDKLPCNFTEIKGWDAARAENETSTNTNTLWRNVKYSFGRKQLMLLAEHVLRDFPMLQGVSYYIHVSSSMGTRPDSISMHLEFICDEPITPDMQKDWLRMQNLMNPTFSRYVSLSKNGASLIWPLDISVADNTKLIFIAHPKFENEASNPIRDEDRILLVMKERLLVASKDIATVQVQQIRDMATSRVTELRKMMGFANKKFRTKYIGIGEKRMEVLLNPDAMSFIIVNDSGEFVHANVNDGDSNGYYWPKSDPTLVYNFKGEPVFRMEDANPEFYALVLEKYAEFLGKAEGRQVFLRRDVGNGGALFAIECDTVNNKLYRLIKFSEKRAADDYLMDNGIMPPENVSYALLQYDPSTEEIRQIVDSNGKEMEKFNNYDEPDVWRYARNVPELEINYENCVDCLRQQAPVTFMLMTHVFAGSVQEMRHFLNWLAAAVNTKKKLGTTWILQGTQGTGKGVMWEHVIMPLFGAVNTKKMTVSELEDKFDSNMAEKTMILVDEFRHADAMGSKKLENKLKLMATEASYSLRAMHQEYKEATNVFQMIFFSNNHDSARIPTGDRRWNVSPRQEKALWTRLLRPEWDREPQEMRKHKAMQRIEGMIEKLHEETKAFANFMRTFQFDMALARIALDNDAKRAMQRASRTRGEDFIAALEEGNFEYFVAGLAGIPRTDPSVVNICRVAITRMGMAVREAERTQREITTVYAEDLLAFYNAMVATKPETVASMDKYLRRMTTFGVERRGNDAVIDLRLKSDELTLASILKEQNDGKSKQSNQPYPTGLGDTGSGAN